MFAYYPHRARAATECGPQQHTSNIRVRDMTTGGHPRRLRCDVCLARGWAKHAHIAARLPYRRFRPCCELPDLVAWCCGYQTSSGKSWSLLAFSYIRCPRAVAGPCGEPG